MMLCPIISGTVAPCFSAIARIWAPSSRKASPSSNATNLATQKPYRTENNSRGSSGGSPSASACSISKRARSAAALVSGAAYPLI
jgi:hypothetical protein